MEKPAAVPTASRIEGRSRFFEANASARRYHWFRH